MIYIFGCHDQVRVTENVDQGVVFDLGNTKVGKTYLVNTLRNFPENS